MTDWYVDSSAIAHMIKSSSNLDTTTPSRKIRFFGYGMILPISHIGSSSITKNIHLPNVLVVSHLTKNMLSISKSIVDHLVDVYFSQNTSIIQDAQPKATLAHRRNENYLYILNHVPQALMARVKFVKSTSFKLWHTFLRHVNSDAISLLNKLGHLSG